jgi:hypothetical protein
MNLQNELLPAFVVCRASKYIALFARANLWTDGIHHALLGEGLEGKVVVATVAQAISIVWENMSQMKVESREGTFSIAESRYQTGFGKFAD